MADKLWGCVRNYWLELIVAFVVLCTARVTTMHDIPPWSFQSLQLIHYALFMLIGVVTMFNSAEARVSTARLLAGKQRSGDAEKR